MKIESSNKKSFKRRFLILFLCALLLTAGCDSMLSADRSHVVYIKDYSLYYAEIDAERVRTRELTSLQEAFAEAQDLYQEQRIANSIMEQTILAGDGSFVIYPKAQSLYFQKTDASEPVLINSDAQLQYMISNDFEELICLTDNLELIRYTIDSGEQQTIASDVYEFFASPDTDLLYYMTNDEELLFAEGDRLNQLIDRGSIEIKHFSEDYKTVYYTKDDSLYKKEVDSASEKILSDDSRILKIYDSGEFYYLKRAPIALEFDRFFVDDMLERDQSSEYIPSGSFPSREDYESYEEYQSALEQESAYTQMMVRNELRSRSEANNLHYMGLTLYYYNGSESVKVLDNIAGREHEVFPGHLINIAADNEKAIAVYNYLDPAEPVRLSQLNDLIYYSLSDFLHLAFARNAQLHLVREDQATALAEPIHYQSHYSDLTSFHPQESSLFYFSEVVDDQNHTNGGKLWRVDFSDDSIGEPQLCDSGVAMYSLSFLTNGSIAYSKSIDSNRFELYIDGQMVGENLQLPFAPAGSDRMYPLSLRFDEREPSELYDHADGDTRPIDSGSFLASDVDENGKLFYIKTTLENTPFGDLMLYTEDAKLIKIDENVLNFDVISGYDWSSWDYAY